MVTSDDVKAMSSLMDVVSGEPPKAPNLGRHDPHASNMHNQLQMNEGPSEVDAMKGILNDLYDVAGPELQAPKQHTNAQPQIQENNFNVVSNDMSYEEYLAKANGQQLRNADPTTGQITQPRSVLNGSEWSVVCEGFDGVKSVNRYSIQNNATHSNIVKDVTLKESAFAVCNMLNDGNPINDPRVIGILSSGMQYTAIVESLVKTLKQKRRVIRESNYDAAKQCDIVMEEKKSKAQDIKTDLVTYLIKNNISHK